MGAQLVRFKFSPKENQQIEALVKIPEEKRSVIHGTVIDKDNKPVKNAVVKLLLLKSPHNPLSVCPITHTFTDEYGQFLFGPLCPNKCYIIKIWFDDVNIKPLVVNPCPGDDYCLTCKECEDPCNPCDPCNHCNDSE